MANASTEGIAGKFKRLGLMSRFGDRTFFATIEEAVSAFQATSAGRGSILSTGL